jgi:hypothetical protein
VPVGDAAWRERAEYRSPFKAPFFERTEAYADMLKAAARSLVQRGYPLRLAQFDFPSTLTPTMVSRLEFASALARLEREMPLAHAAIIRYELRIGARWPRNVEWCRALGCPMSEAREAAWHGWLAITDWICDNGSPQNPQTPHDP